MKETFETIEYKGKKYPLVCNINVMEEIQKRYKSFTEWSNLCGGTTDKKEVDIAAFKTGILLMINEGLLIESEDNGTEFKEMTPRQVGRLISEVGLVEITNKLTKVIVESVGVDTRKNELSTKMKTQ